MELRKRSGTFVLSLFNYILSAMQAYLVVRHTVDCESEDPGILGGVVTPSPTSSAASSSISVVSVPFEVTGDGPTISLGLAICALLGESPSSIGLG